MIRQSRPRRANADRGQEPDQQVAENGGQQEHAQPQREPGRHNQFADVRRGHAPGQNAGACRQAEETEQPEDPVDQHRGDRLRPPDLHSNEIGRFDEVTPDRAGDHQSEDVTDATQQHRGPELEPWLDDPHQHVPAHIRNQQTDLVDHQPESEQTQVQPVAEHLDDLFPVLPHHQTQQRQGQRHQAGIDDQTETRVLGGTCHGIPIAPRGSVPSGLARFRDVVIPECDALSSRTIESCSSAQSARRDLDLDFLEASG